MPLGLAVTLVERLANRLALVDREATRHRQEFRVFWTRKSCRRIGRPPVAEDVLIEALL
jgi:hypothetical protein